jgi:hypothetical protein
MDLFWIYYIIVSWIANMALCSWLADEKHRSKLNWVVLALFFGILATITLVGAPINQEATEMKKEQSTTSVRR